MDLDPDLLHFEEFELSGPVAVMAVIFEYTAQVCEIGGIIAVRQRDLDNYILGITNGRKPIEASDDIVGEKEDRLAT